MPDPRRLLPSSRPFQVLSLNVQAQRPPDRLPPTFELLVRHLFDRLLNNDAFGEDSAVRVAQLAYAIALPGLLVALYLFAAYHQPPTPHIRPYWSQAAEHLFYVIYSFVILGLTMVLQWDLLFPDLLDIFILSTLPIARVRLLLARVLALALFLAFVQLATSALGDIFFPAAADLSCGFWHHFAAHTLAVTSAGIFAAAAFVAVQSVLTCLPYRIAGRIIPLAKVLAVIALLSILFLFPLLAHYLRALLASHLLLRCFPPFWFLGIYETLLLGPAALPIFHHLAVTGLDITLYVAAFDILLYPFAYTRRVAQVVEGTTTRQAPPPFAALFHRLLHTTLIRTPATRAVFHFTSQTLLRLPRLHLYLSMYAGLAFALVLSGLLVFHLDAGRIHTLLSSDGIRMAVPVLTFWIVAALRTALLAPLGRKGSWLFHVIPGDPPQDPLHAPRLLVQTLATTLTLTLVLLLHLAAPPELRALRTTLTQIILAIGLSITLTDLFFLTLRDIPFTVARRKTTRELPFIFVRYFVVFPAFALTTVQAEPWIEASAPHLLFTAFAFLATHLALSRARLLILQLGEPPEELLFTGLGLRED